MIYDALKLYNVDGSLARIIADYYELKVTSKINSLTEMEFSVPINSEYVKMLKPEMQVSINDINPDKPFYDIFTIRNIERHIGSGTVQVYAVQAVDTLARSIVSKFVNTDNSSTYKKQPKQTIDYVLSRAGITSWTCEYGSSVSAERPYNKLKYEGEHQTVLQYIQDIAEKWGIELTYDTINKVVKVWKRNGFGVKKPTCIFWDDLNLLNIDMTVDSSDVINRAYAYGKEVNGTRVNVNGLIGQYYVDEINQLEAPTYTVGRRCSGFYVDNDEDNVQDLYDAAVAFIKENCKPKVSFAVSIADLAMVSDEYKHFNFELGDSVRIGSRMLDESTPDDLGDIDLRVVSVTRYPNDPSQTSIEVANFKNDLATIQANLIRSINKQTDTRGKMK